MSDDLLDIEHVCTPECTDRRVEIVACTEADMDLSGIAEYDARERWLLSPHTDCEHVEYDLLEICRMCGRHRSECEPI